jgi:hypothetical protein
MYNNNDNNKKKNLKCTAFAVLYMSTPPTEECEECEVRERSIHVSLIKLQPDIVISYADNSDFGAHSMDQ